MKSLQLPKYLYTTFPNYLIYIVRWGGGVCAHSCTRVGIHICMKPISKYAFSCLSTREPFFFKSTSSEIIWKSLEPKKYRSQEGQIASFQVLFHAHNHARFHWVHKLLRYLKHFVLYSLIINFDLWHHLTFSNHTRLHVHYRLTKLLKILEHWCFNLEVIMHRK